MQTEADHESKDELIRLKDGPLLELLDETSTKAMDLIIKELLEKTQNNKDFDNAIFGIAQFLSSELIAKLCISLHQNPEDFVKLYIEAFTKQFNSSYKMHMEYLKEKNGVH